MFSMVAKNKEEHDKMYDFFYGRYKDKEIDDLIKMYDIHQSLSERRNDFHDIGKIVCSDIIMQKDDSVVKKSN